MDVAKDVGKAFAIASVLQAAAAAISFFVMGRSERLFDLSGTLTFLAVFWWSRRRHGKHTKYDATWWATTLSTAWALRLGLFLTWRVFSETGGDSRFDAFKEGPAFLVPWVIQAVWVTLIGAPVYLPNLRRGRDGADNTSATKMTPLQIGGLITAAAGLALETAADVQKTLAKRVTKAPVTDGLFAVVRYPNYLGEVTFWSGLAMVAYDRRHAVASAVAAASPVVTYVLLRFVSGVPLSEARRKSTPAYAKYKRRTPAILPFPRLIK